MEGSRKKERRHEREGDQKLSRFKVGRRSNMEISPPPFSRLNRVALNGHGGGRWREAIVRQDHAALTHESPKRVSAG
jgi:hypothetical protein